MAKQAITAPGKAGLSIAEYIDKHRSKLLPAGPTEHTKERLRALRQRGGASPSQTKEALVALAFEASTSNANKAWDSMTQAPARSPHAWCHFHGWCDHVTSVCFKAWEG